MNHPCRAPLIPLLNLAVFAWGCAAPLAQETTPPSEPVQWTSSSQQVFAPPIVESPQRTPNWCWAACFECALRSSGVATDQRTVVRVVKGAVVNEKISIPDILAGFNGRGMSVKYVIGKPDRTEVTSFLTGAAPGERRFIIERRANGTLDWHAVVIWGFEVPPDGRLLVYMYDPLVNREFQVWYTYDDRWLGTFYVTVTPLDASKYWVARPNLLTDIRSKQ